MNDHDLSVFGADARQTPERAVDLPVVRSADQAGETRAESEAVMDPWEAQWRRSLRLQGRAYRPMKPHELDSMKDYIRCVEIRAGKAAKDTILEL